MLSRPFFPVLFFLFLPVLVAAHTFPVGLIHHGGDLRFSPRTLDIDYRIAMSEIEAARMRAVLNAAPKSPGVKDGEGAYIRSVADQVMAGLEVTLDGRLLPLENLQRYIAIEPVGMQYSFRARLPVLSEGIHHLVIRDGNDVDVAGTEELTLAVQPGLEIVGHERRWRFLSLRFHFPDRRIAPQTFHLQQALDLPAAPPRGEAGGSLSTFTEASEGTLNARIRSILAGPLDTAIVTFSLLLAFLLGALHALQPGHGKTLVAAYLVGTRGTARHAVLLGLIVTFTHTFSVLLLGIIVLFLSHLIVPATLARWLEIGSALLVLVMGGWLLSMALSDRQQSVHTHGDGPFHHSHGVHPHDDAHHHHASGEHHHAGVHDPHQKKEGVSLWSLLILGITGGIVPCPDAIILLLIAVGFNRIAFGLVLILVFSTGIAIVLIAVGLLMVSGSALIQRLDSGHLFVRKLPVVSAAFILLIGAGMLARFAF